MNGSKDLEMRSKAAYIGSVFMFIGVCAIGSKQMGLDAEAIQEEMKASDYENLVLVFDKYFGDFCTLLR